MAKQYQLPNGTYLNDGEESSAREYQLPTGIYVNERESAAAPGGLARIFGGAPGGGGGLARIFGG